MKRLFLVACSLAGFLSTSMAASASEVPVFRDARESSWQPAAFEVRVFHEGALTGESAKQASHPLTGALVKLDRRQRPWRKLLEELQAKAAEEPAKHLASNKNQQDNKQANAGENVQIQPGTQPAPPAGKSVSPDVKSPARTGRIEGPANSNSVLLRNSLIALLVGIAVVAVVYFLGRFVSPPA